MQQVARLVVVVFLILLIGSVLFAAIERVGFFEGLYFTVATVTTVGYGDITPQTTAGKALATVLMLGGVGAALYLFSLMVAFLVEGRLLHVLGTRRMKRMIGKLRDHFIICGFGRLGRRVAQDLEAAGARFVIVEHDKRQAIEARECGYAVVEGDATLPETLREAGVERAAGLATTISDDAENIYIGITVRSLCSELPVLCRSSSERVTDLFRRAGIERTISTEAMGARRIVNTLLRPHVVGFMDEITQLVAGKPALHAVRVPPAASLVGQTIRSSGLRDRYGVVALAIRRGGSYLPNPGPDERLAADDILILVGTPEQVAELRATAGNVRGEEESFGARAES
ncbi:MAG: hypothetical protein GF330_03375 [Candidatus Eisenbacteria bacterium]|nr:hypothetical protein [Candidatus Eisenbacteria bacterium]